MPRPKSTPTFKAAIIAMAMAGLSAAGAAEQASFAVNITLHAQVKPMSAAQLCSGTKPLERPVSAVSVSCPDLSGQSAAPAAQASGPTAVVTF